MIEQTAGGNEIELACLRKDVEDWKRRAEEARADATMWFERSVAAAKDLDNAVFTYAREKQRHVEAVKALKHELRSFRLAASALVLDTEVLRKLVERST